MCAWVSRWRICYRNIQKCIKHQNPKKIARDCFRHFCEVLMEGFYLRRLSFSNRLYVSENADYHELVKTKRAIVLTAHIGQWEILSLVMAQKAASPVHVVYQKIGNQWLNDWVVKTRSQFGVKMWEKNKGFLTMLQQVKNENGIIAMLADQGKGDLIDFFGNPTPFPDSPTRIAKRMQLPVYWMCCVRKGRKFEVQVKKLDPTAIKEDYVSCLQQTIEAYPEQYFWMHRIWKKAAS